MEYIYLGRNEWVALAVGLITGALYSWLSLPIPAPNVFGGILAIIFTFIGYVIIQKAKDKLLSEASEGDANCRSWSPTSN